MGRSNRQKGTDMFDVYEVFKDGTKFFMAGYEDAFDAEVYARNHEQCTTALRNGWSKIEVIHTDRENGQPERR